MRTTLTLCLVTTALALASCKGGGAGTNAAAAGNNTAAAAGNAASAPSSDASANSAAPAGNSTASDGQPLTREFLVGRWAVEHGECSSSVDFDAEGIMGPPAGTRWTLSGNTLTLTQLDHTTTQSTVTRTGPDSMIMTRSTDGTPLSYTRCH